MKRNQPAAALPNFGSQKLRAQNRRLKQLVADLILNNYLVEKGVARMVVDEIWQQIEADAAAPASPRRKSGSEKSS